MGVNKFKTVLAIETSCDDTSVAIISNQKVLWVETKHQIEAHSKFKGVVPEIAGRNHLELLLPLIAQAMKETKFTYDKIDGIAVTNRPGLISSLIVGVVTAKTLALSKNKPLIGVDHLEGHIFAPFLIDKEYKPAFSYNLPFIALIVSGGHSLLVKVDKPFKYTIIGRCLDDAAGEAFDKLSKALNLGFPGGALVNKKASMGDPKKFDFPRALNKKDNFDFSFSGLKTYTINKIKTLKMDDQTVCDICASFQEAVVDVLVKKLIIASKKYDITNLVVSGGVSANTRLRQRLNELVGSDVKINIPPIRYCTDNAAMIGLAGILRLNAGYRSTQTLSPKPNSELCKLKIS